MIRENSSRQTRQSRLRSFPSSRLPLLALLVASSTATIMACSSDDDGDAAGDVAPLDGIQPVEVPERDLPAVTPAPAPAAPRSDTPNGLSVPDGILDWRVIGVVNVPPPANAMPGAVGTLRVIVGNPTAVTAARAGQTNPWPDGTQIGHFQWTAGTNPDWEAMVAPGDFARITLMDKSSARTNDGGWAYGVWNGNSLVPPAAGFDQACIDCHTDSVGADQDYVFTIPAPFPTQAAIDAAPTLPNDLALPEDILDWRVIGASSRETDPTPTIRVIVGNDIAVAAARAGETNPWPDGSMLAHYVWAIGDNNPKSADTVNAAAFNGFTLMVKNAGDYAADGGWAYGNWNTPELTGPTDATFDDACVQCHTDTVGADNDFVFTRPGSLPTDLFPAPAQAL
jgi:hypothetical protein